MELKRFGIAIIVAHALAITAWGHHSHGNYQMIEWVEFDGTVMDVYWINPPAWVYMDVSNGCLLGFITTSDGVEKMWD